VTQHEILISPELVLVDPELAAFARARLGEPGDLGRRATRAASADVPATEAVGAVEDVAAEPSHAGGRSRGRARTVLVTLSIGLNLLLALMLLSQTARSAGPGSAVLRPPPAAAVTPSELTRAQAEQEVLAGLSGNRQLRRRFVDPATAVPFAPVSASCEPRAGGEAAAAVYRCVLSERRNGKLVTDVVDYPAAAKPQVRAQGQPRKARARGSSSGSLEAAGKLQNLRTRR
jgi:hypothetical protein